MIRLAAVGDVHVGTDSRGLLRARLRHLREHADVLLLAGDLTRCGQPDEMRALADDLAGLGVPVVTVLGNHDHHAERVPEVVKVLEDAGITVLEGTHTVLDIGGVRFGVAGTKGFGGGFANACATDFGEIETKLFIRHTRALADQLSRDLDALRAARCDVTVALLHYAPVPDTVVGERLEIYPFLGSYLFAEAVDRAGADLVLHGHAHQGSEKGVTAAGIPVRNVAQPVIRQAYDLFELAGDRAPVASLR